MGALNAWFLAATATLAVPIFLHLFQRQQTRRLSFPALRYLERTEREHARTIRLRQLLLLAVRASALLLIVLAGARVFVFGRGAAHPPTAVVIVLDNSLSSDLVLGDHRRLDELKDAARYVLSVAGPDDVFWVVRAGAPWMAAFPGGADQALASVEATAATAGRGDLSSALERARALLASSDLTRREIHLLSDLQASAFDPSIVAPAGDVPVVVWTPEDEPPRNRALTGLMVGAGLPPLEGQTSEITVTREDASDTTGLPVRLMIGGLLRGATTVLPGAQASLALAATASGWTEGSVEAEPDALAADDRRTFAFRTRPAPTVWTGETPGRFLAEALGVLTDAGRIRSAPPAVAELVLAPAGEGIDRAGTTASVVVMPAADPSLLPALNRRLGDAGVPWRFGGTGPTGETPLQGTAIPEPFEGLVVRSAFVLEPFGEAGLPSTVLGEAGGRPWAVETHDTDGRRVLILASPLDDRATSLPTSTGMLRFVDWAASQWAGRAGLREEHLAGLPLAAPPGATQVVLPSGERLEIDGSRTVQATAEAGIYRFVDADSTVSLAAVNPPASESRLAPLDRRAFRAAIGTDVTAARGAAAWRRGVFRARQGPELGMPLLLLALVLLAWEPLLAASRRATPGRTPPLSTTSTDVG